MKTSELYGCWKMHQYYIYNKYFVDMLTTHSLYQKSFINNTLKNIKRMYWFHYKIVTGSQRKTSKWCLNFNLNQINYWWTTVNTSKTKLKQITHKINTLCMLQTGRKALLSIIRCGKLTIKFYKKLFSSIISSYIWK